MKELSYQEKLEYLKLLEERESRNMTGGHLCKIWPDEGPLSWKEYPKHMNFIRAGQFYRERFFCAGNRTGKSLTGTYEVSAHATGLYPSWWMGRKYDRPVEVWCAGDTAKTTRDILQRELIGPPGDIGTGMIPKDRISNLRMKAGVPDAVDSFKVKHESGGWSRIGFLSYDQKRRAFQGTSKDIILLDEEPPNDVYSECVMRTMTTDGMVLVTATPLLGLSEFIQEFMDNADHGDLPDIKVEL